MSGQKHEMSWAAYHAGTIVWASERQPLQTLEQLYAERERTEFDADLVFGCLLAVPPLTGVAIVLVGLLKLAFSG